MFYKIENQEKVQVAIAWFNELKKVESARKEYLEKLGKELGCEISEYIPEQNVMGGVIAVKIPFKPDDYWCCFRAHMPNYYCPRVHTAAKAEIRSLLVLTFEEIIKVTNYPENKMYFKNGNMYFSTRPAFFLYNNVLYFTMDIDLINQYDKPDYVVEILPSEYKKASEELNQKRKTEAAVE